MKPSKASALFIKPAKKRIKGQFKPASVKSAAACSGNCVSGTCKAINAK